MAMVKGADKVVKAEGFVLTTLKEVMKAMNGAGILASPLKMVGKTKEVMVSDFMAAIEGVEPGSDEEKKIPAEVIKLYNDFVDVIEDKKVGLDVPEKGETPAPVSDKKGVKGKAEKSVYGHRLGSESAAIDDALKTGGKNGVTIKEIAEQTKLSVGRIKGHLAHLKKTGKAILIEKEDKYFVE